MDGRPCSGPLPQAVPLRRRPRSSPVRCRQYLELGVGRHQPGGLCFEKGAAPGSHSRSPEGVRWEWVTQGSLETGARRALRLQLGSWGGPRIHSRSLLSS